MGDRSPKSKQRDQKQKDAAKSKEKTKKQVVIDVGRTSASGNKKQNRPPSAKESGLHFRVRRRRRGDTGDR